MTLLLWLARAAVSALIGILFIVSALAEAGARKLVPAQKILTNRLTGRSA